MQNIKQLLLQPDTGKKVLETLTKESGTALPAEGILAGQSVLSALNQLANNSNKVIYNDIDIFQFKKFERQKYKVTGRNRAAVLHEIYAEQDDYSQVYTGTVRFFNSTRTGPLNNITVNAATTEDYIASDKHLKTLLLKTFDINSVKVGVDLKNEKLFWEEEFIGYLNTQQLQMSLIMGPIQSLLRVLNKKENNQGYLDLEYAINVAMAAIMSDYGHITARTEIEQEPPEFLATYNKVQEQQWIIENQSIAQRAYAVRKFWDANLKKQAYSNFKGPVFGKKYYEFYCKHEEKLAPFFELVALPHKNNNIYYPLIKSIPASFLEKMSSFEMLLNSDWNNLNIHKRNNKGHWLYNYEKVLNPSTKQSEKDNIKKLLNTPLQLVQDLLVKSYSLKTFRKNIGQILVTGSYSNKTKAELAQFYDAHRTELKKSVQECKTVSQVYENLNQSYKNIVSTWSARDVNKAFAAHHKYHSVIKEITAILKHESLPLRERLKQEPPATSIKLRLREVEGQCVYVAQSANRFGYENQKEIYVAEDQEKLFQELSANKNLFANKQYVMLLKHVHALNFAMTNEAKRKELQPEWERDEEYFQRKIKSDLGAGAKFEVKQLRTEFELEQEGEEMSHCVGGYSTLVSQGICSIWQLHDCTLLTSSTLEVRKSSKTITINDKQIKVDTHYIVQNRARHNRAPSDALQYVANILIQALDAYALKTATSEQSDNSPA